MNLPEKKPLHNEMAGTMTHEEAIEIITRAQQDKHLAREVEALRDKCCHFIQDMVHHVNQSLAEQDKKVPALLRANPDSSKPDSAISLRAAAQQREEASRRRRELAEAMVIGALRNFDNPDWDPRSNRPAGKGGLIMALIKTSAAWRE